MNATIDVTCPDCGLTRRTRKKNKYSSSILTCRACSIKRVKREFKLLNWSVESHERKSGR